jgi:flagellin
MEPCGVHLGKAASKEVSAMGMKINTNIPSLSILNQTKRTTSQVSNNLMQMASGRRINKAADDASGMAIADRFATMSAQNQQEINSLQEGINYAQTADGALNSQSEVMGRVRELALQASNGTLTDDQRSAINGEAQQLLQQVNDTANNTQYNGQAMLKQDTTVDLGIQGGNMQVATKASNTNALGLDSLDLTTQGGAQSAIDTIDSALKSISQNQSNLGGQVNRFTSAIQEKQIQMENNLASESAIRDADYAQLFIKKTRGDVMSQTNVAMLAQSNVSMQNVMSLLR